MCRVLFPASLVLVILLLPKSASAGTCEPLHVRCWLLCNSPPTLISVDAAIPYLQTVPNRRLNWFARSSGFITTPLGKRLGIRGWRDYCQRVWVRGVVLQSAKSYDRLQTVDLRIEEFGPEGQSPLALKCQRYIRVEIFPGVVNVNSAVRRAGCKQQERYEIHGRLQWDADGFLEIHPERDEDVKPIA